MKRKEINAAIKKAISSKAKVRDKADFYENVLSFIWNISDKERCDYYDMVTLYVIYGIEPDFSTFSDTKKNQFGLIFSLLKKQRIAFENSRKSDNCVNLPHGDAYIESPTQIVNTINSNNKEEKEKELNTLIENAVECFNNFSFGLFGNVNLPLTPKQKRQLQTILANYNIESFKSAVILATQSDFLKGGGANGWTMTFDWFIAINNFEKVLNGNYNKNKTDNLKTYNDEYYPTY